MRHARSRVTYRPTLWAALITLDRAAARADLLQELKARRGNVDRTARELEVSSKSMRRWIRQLEMEDDLAMIRTTAQKRP